jgi:hypothetical protein
MARIRQYYDPPGVPLVVEGDPADAVTAWRSQRVRVRGWLDGLDDGGWSAPTRCESWDTTGLVRHMASASQFLSYTLREASTGNATTLLTDMDTRTTVADAASLLGDLSPADARALLAQVDAAVDDALDTLGGPGLLATAEAPPGHLAAHLSLNHFLFDSWVHEYDLMLPRGEHPPVDTRETTLVVRYLAGLATILSGSALPLVYRLTDPDLLVGVTVEDGVTTVTTGSAPVGSAVVEGRVVDVVDRMTGRTGAPVGGDPRGLQVLDDFASVLAT